MFEIKVLADKLHRPTQKVDGANQKLAFDNVMLPILEPKTTKSGNNPLPNDGDREPRWFSEMASGRCLDQSKGTVQHSIFIYSTFNAHLVRLVDIFDITATSLSAHRSTSNNHIFLGPVYGPFFRNL